MAINFPNAPQINDIFTSDDRTWQWNGIYWRSFNAVVGYTGSQGEQGNLGYTGSSGGVNAITTFPTAINSDVTIAAGENALSVGPLTQATGTVITITAGQRWIIL